jgi:hypothetical protein
LLYASCMRLDCCQLPWLKIARTTSISRLQQISIGPRRKKVRPHVDWWSRLVYNLQEIWFCHSVKHNIISIIPYCSNQSTNSNTNLSFFLINLVKTISKYKWSEQLSKVCKLDEQNGQFINKWLIISSDSRYTHLAHPFYRLFARLYLVRSTFRYRNHIKILIFSGTYLNSPQVFF